MHRTQLNLDEWQYEALRSRAEREERSISDLVREILAAALRPLRGVPRRRLEDLAGIGDDPALSGADHDQVLYGRSSES